LALAFLILLLLSSDLFYYEFLESFVPFLDVFHELFFSLGEPIRAVSCCFFATFFAIPMMYCSKISSSFVWPCEGEERGLFFHDSIYSTIVSLKTLEQASHKSLLFILLVSFIMAFLFSFGMNLKLGSFILRARVAWSLGAPSFFYLHQQYISHVMLGLGRGLFGSIHYYQSVAMCYDWILIQRKLSLIRVEVGSAWCAEFPA